MKWTVLATLNPRGVDLTLPSLQHRPYVSHDNPQTVNLTWEGASTPEGIRDKVLKLGRAGLVPVVALLLGHTPHLDDFDVIDTVTKDKLAP